MLSDPLCTKSSCRDPFLQVLRPENQLLRPILKMLRPILGMTRHILLSIRQQIFQRSGTVVVLSVDHVDKRSVVVSFFESFTTEI